MRLYPQGEGAEVSVPLESLLAFVRAGGSVSLAQWLELPEDVQGAMERAGTAVRAEFALAIAAALTGEDGAGAVAQAVDGGASSDEIAVRRALDRAAGMLRKGGE